MPSQTGGKRQKRRTASKSQKRSASKSRKRSVKKRTVKKRTTSRGPMKLNRWQKFLHRHRGKGMSQRQLRTAYRKEYM